LAIVTCLLQTVKVCPTSDTNSVVYRLRKSDDSKRIEGIAHECGINANFLPL